MQKDKEPDQTWGGGGAGVKEGGFCLKRLSKILAKPGQCRGEVEAPKPESP